MILGTENCYNNRYGVSLLGTYTELYVQRSMPDARYQVILCCALSLILGYSQLISIELATLARVFFRDPQRCISTTKVLS